MHAPSLHVPADPPAQPTLSQPPRRFRHILMVVLIGGLFLSLGNAPAPYYACEGKAVGDTCTYGYGCSGNGTCQLSQSFTDNPNTELNESLVCNTGD